MRKEAQKLFVVAVILLVLVVPVAAGGGFFSGFFGWLKDFFSGSPTGAQVFQPVLTGVSPSSVAQGAVAPLLLYGSFTNQTASVSSADIFILNQSILNSSVMEVWLRVGVFANGSYNLSVGNDSVSFSISEGPLDPSTIVYDFNVSNVSFGVNISASDFVNPAQITISNGSLTFVSNVSSVKVDLIGVVSSGSTFSLLFSAPSFNSSLYVPSLNLSLSFAESFSPSVQVDESFGLSSFNVQNYPAACPWIMPPPACCPPIFGACPAGFLCGSDLVCEPEAFGGFPALQACPLGTSLCWITNFPALGVQDVCDSLHIGPYGPCGGVFPPAGTACTPPWPPVGTCTIPAYLCPAGAMFCALGLGYKRCSICGDGFVQPSEKCDPPAPGPDPVNCPGSNFCNANCQCAPQPAGGGGGGGGGPYIKRCYKNPGLCEQVDEVASGIRSPQNFRPWSVAVASPAGELLTNPEIDAGFPSFQACWDQNVGMEMFGSDEHYLDAFTVAGSDGLRRWAVLPEGYPPADAEFYYEKQAEFKSRLGERSKYYGVVDEPAEMCVSGPHIIAVSKAQCDVSDGVLSIYWTRGWYHYWKQPIDRIDFLSTGYVMSSEGFPAYLIESKGPKPDLSVTDIIDGLVDGRTDSCKSDDEECVQTVKKVLKNPPAEWRLVLKSIAQDTQQKKDVQVFTLSPDDCTVCPLYIAVDGVEYPNPCCQENSNVPSACCDENNNFLQGQLLSKSSGQCYSVSKIIDGPKENVCLVGQNMCDISSPGFIFDKSAGLYNQFGWTAVGVDCSVVFDPFSQSFYGSAFSDAVDVCPPVPVECVDGEKKTVGERVGICRPAVLECQDEHWVVVEPGVAPRFEVCNGKDDDCNNQIDDILLCECPGSRATQPCFADSSTPVQTCENRRGHYFWDDSECGRRERDKTVNVAEPAPDQFAVQTVSGFGVPCGTDEFSCCVAFNKQTDGDIIFDESVVSVPEGFVPVGSYRVQNCEGSDIDIAMNVVPVESAVAVFRSDKEKKLPVGLKTTLDCAGFDYQLLSDKSVVPEVILKEISEGVVLSEDSKLLSALGVKVEFSGDVDGLKVGLRNADVKIRNKGLVTIGAPFELDFEPRENVNVRISAPLILKKNIDMYSLGFYVLQDGEWKYLGGSVENDMFVVDVDDVAQYSPFVFMIAGSKCNGCEQAYLTMARDVNSPVLVVLVHGFMSAPDLAWKSFLKQFRDEEVAVDVGVFAYQGMRPDDAVVALNEKLRAVSGDYNKIVFIAHSLGGLITQRFLLDNPDIVPKVDAVIVAGTPFEGTAVAGAAENIFDLFAVLLDNDDNSPMFGVHKETLEALQVGMPEPFPNVKSFALVGTRDLLGFGSAFGLGTPNDAMVEASSATKAGEFRRVCVDVLEHPQNHFMLNRAADERYTLLYFLRELSSDFRLRAPSQMYAMLRIENCEPGEVVIYGKPVNSKVLPAPYGCEDSTCGDGVCQTTENVNNCERDCLPPRKEFAVGLCGVSSWAVNMLLLLTVLLVIGYALRAFRKPSSALIWIVYLFSGFSLVGLIGNLVLCGTVPFVPLIIFGIVMLILLIDYYVKFIPRFYRWH